MRLNVTTHEALTLLGVKAALGAMAIIRELVVSTKQMSPDFGSAASRLLRRLAPRNDRIDSSLRAHGSGLDPRPEDRLREAILSLRHRP
jgi:hypothetical protein